VGYLAWLALVQKCHSADDLRGFPGMTLAGGLRLHESFQPKRQRAQLESRRAYAFS
jgi:hypothetical protein